MADEVTIAVDLITQTSTPKWTRAICLFLLPTLTAIASHAKPLNPQADAIEADSPIPFALPWLTSRTTRKPFCIAKRCMTTGSLMASLSHLP